MTDVQLQALIAALRGPEAPAAGVPAPAHAMPGTAAVVGTMAPCNLGRNKLKRFKKWNDWIRDAENKMRFLGLTSNAQKISFIRSCAGPDLTEFWEKEARLRFEEIPAEATYSRQTLLSCMCTSKVERRYSEQDRIHAKCVVWYSDFMRHVYYSPVPYVLSLAFHGDL